MKKSALILTLLIPLSIHASESCSKVELRGSIIRVENDLELVIAQKTLSEKKLKIPYQIQLSFSPYVDKFIKGIFITEGDSLLSGQKILKVEKIDIDSPDPLNQNEKNTFKKLKGVKCPVI